jgi:hypothetical protein
MLNLRVGVDGVSEKVKEEFEQINIKLDRKEMMTEPLTKIMNSMIQRLGEVEAMCRQVHVDRNEMLEKEKLRISGIEREVGEKAAVSVYSFMKIRVLMCLIEEVPKFPFP